MLFCASLVTTFVILNNQLMPGNELVAGIISLIIVSACAAIDEQYRAKNRRKKSKYDEEY